MVLNKNSKDLWVYQGKVGTSYITIADTVNGAPAGNVCTMTTHESLVANDLKGWKMIGLTGDNVGVVFTVVSNTLANPTLVTLSGTPVTPADLAGDTVSFQKAYRFGEYNKECGKWSIPVVENPSESHWVWNSGTPTLTNSARTYPTFKKQFLPVTAQVYAWFQGKPVDADPAVTISTLTSGMTFPLTIRVEELGGTHPDNVQAVDCYCVGLASNAVRGKEFLVTAEIAYGSLEDINDNPNLTADLLAAGLMTGPYNGNPILEWNSVSIPGVERAMWVEKKEFSVVSGGEGVINTTHTFKTERVTIVLAGGIEVDDLWDDYKARTTRDMTIQVKKFDETSNILFTFTNCKIKSYERIGEQYEGKYASLITIDAEKVTESADWFTEGGVTFADHWKANI